MGCCRSRVKLTRREGLTTRRGAATVREKCRWRRHRWGATKLVVNPRTRNPRENPQKLEAQKRGAEILNDLNAGGEKRVQETVEV